MRIVLITILCLVTVSVYAGSNPVANQVSLPKRKPLPINRNRRIVGGIPTNNGFIVITEEEHSPPFEKCLYIVTCDINGVLLNQAKLITEGFFTTTDEPNIPLIGIDPRKSESLWVAYYDGTELRQRFLPIKDTKEDDLLRKCWLLKAHGKIRLFLDASVFKQIGTKSSFSLIDTRWLYCYTLENGRLELESKSLVAEAKTESDEFGVECVLANGKVHIWVCEEGGKSSIGLLRVAEWEKDKRLKWTECYRGRKGEKLRELTVDALSGCDAAVFTYRKQRWTASCTLCQIKADNSVACANLGDKFMSFPAKKQLLRVDHPDMAWLLLHAMRVVVVDENSRVLREMSGNFSTVSDVHLVRGSDDNAYIVEATKNGNFRITKVP